MGCLLGSLRSARKNGGKMVTCMETRRGWMVISWVSMLLLGAVSAAAADDVHSAIEAANKQFEDSAIRGDAQAAAALYTAEGQLLPAQSDFVNGTHAIG